jgi:hypothetical protein
MLCFLELRTALVLLDWRAVIRFLELCMDALLCKIIALHALVSLDQLTMLRFLKLHCSLTIYALPRLVGFLFAAGCCSTLLKLEVPLHSGDDSAIGR